MHSLVDTKQPLRGHISQAVAIGLEFLFKALIDFNMIRSQFD